MCGVLPIQRENGKGTKILGKSDIFKGTKKTKKRKKYVQNKLPEDISSSIIGM